MRDLAKVTLASIQMDTSIQCRAEIDMATVNEYAEAVRAGARFPPVHLYGTAKENWIGDGWHRILAARQAGRTAISCNLRRGGRREALKHALAANALHGRRRTNADKRRCVEIALAEFPKFSSRAVAKMCGVHPSTVDAIRPASLPESGNATRTASDGRQYPAHRKPAKAMTTGEDQRKEGEPQTTEERREMGPPEDGISCAELAISHLEQIRPEDAQRKQAWAMMREWLDEHE